VGAEGYVCIRVDSRGVCKSPGLQAPFSVQEAEDYYDAHRMGRHPALVEWECWFVGHVVPGNDQHNVASLQPPHLKAMIGAGHRCDIYNEALYGGGIFGAGFWNWWWKIWSGNNHCGNRRQTDWMAARWPRRSTTRRPMARAAPSSCAPT